MKLKAIFIFLGVLISTHLSTMDLDEPSDDWTQTFHIQDMILNEHSRHQNIVIFKNRTVGKVLMLDDIIQFAENDEFIYHEMIAHVPLLLHPKPKKILIIGGGDGAVLREVLKHDSVDQVTVVELDGKIVDVCQKHFPHLSKNAFEDSRVRLLIDDGFKYLKKTHSYYDVILVGTTDPFGPAKPLFKKQFYKLCYTALTPDGVLVSQNGSPLIQLDNLIKFKEMKNEIFENSSFYFCPAPSQLTGMKAFSISFKGKGHIKPSLKELNKRYKQINGELKYYSPETHLSSFYVPKYLKDLLK